jgi:hypothetical protein
MEFLKANKSDTSGRGKVGTFSALDHIPAIISSVAVFGGVASAQEFERAKLGRTSIYFG